MTPKRDPRNAPGPFYVEEDLCLLCGAPEAEAPDLITLEDDGCYFKRQPETEEEVERAIAAVHLACCGAYRYGGRDASVIQRLLAAGVHREQIDALTTDAPE